MDRKAIHNVLESKEFKELVSKRWSISLILTFLMLFVYFGFILVLAFDKELPSNFKPIRPKTEERGGEMNLFQTHLGQTDPVAIFFFFLFIAITQGSYISTQESRALFAHPRFCRGNCCFPSDPGKSGGRDV